MCSQDNRHGLIIILPNKIDGLKETERLLLELDYTPNKVLQSMQSDKQVFLKLPKFKIHFRKDLKDFLREVGSINVDFTREIDNELTYLDGFTRAVIFKR